MPKNKGKISIKKILIALLSLVMVVGFIWLFVAASGQERTGICEGLNISLSETGDEAYVDTAKVRSRIVSSEGINPVGKPIDQLKMGRIKQNVKGQDWVKKVEIYLDNHQFLNVRITQRVPIARVFRTDGSSFYLVNNGNEINADGKFAIKLPVFTNFPSNQNTRNDSVLFKQTKKISKFIAGSKFWEAQIEQININKEMNFELVPQVGDALILLGNSNGIAEKLEKLMVFYKKGLDNIGWGFYDTLDLRFDGQIVAVRKEKSGNPVVNALIKSNDPDSKAFLENNIQKRTDNK